jgi:hypothetical protein
MNTATTIAIVVIMAALTFIAAYSFAVMNAFAQTTPAQSCKPGVTPPAPGPTTGHQASGCGQAHKPG